jgi:hypothetical protein
LFIFLDYDIVLFYPVTGTSLDTVSAAPWQFLETRFSFNEPAFPVWAANQVRVLLDIPQAA